MQAKNVLLQSIIKITRKSMASVNTHMNDLKVILHTLPIILCFIINPSTTCFVAIMCAFARVCVTIIIVFLCLFNHHQPIILIHSSLNSTTEDPRVDTGSAWSAGWPRRENLPTAVNAGTCYSTRRQSRIEGNTCSECTSPPLVFVIFFFLKFFFLFCLNVDSPQRSRPPATDPRLIYWCILHTETLLLVHWRLKYTWTKYMFLQPRYKAEFLAEYEEKKMYFITYILCTFLFFFVLTKE